MSAQGTYRFYSNARRFYSSKGNPLDGKGLTSLSSPFLACFEISFTELLALRAQIHDLDNFAEIVLFLAVYKDEVELMLPSHGEELSALISPKCFRHKFLAVAHKQ